MDGIKNILNEFNRIDYLSIKINNYYDDFEDDLKILKNCIKKLKITYDNFNYIKGELPF